MCGIEMLQKDELVEMAFDFKEDVLVLDRTAMGYTLFLLLYRQ